MKITRVIVTLLLVLAGPAAVAYVRVGQPLRTTTAPAVDPRLLPLQLGDWSGQEIGLDPDLYKAIGADIVVNRLYRNAIGRTVSLHIAAFQNLELRTPHEPRVCYSGSGYLILDTAGFEVEATGYAPASAALMSVAKDGAPSAVLYWYQLGSSTYHTPEESKDAFRRYWGHAQWPPVVKVMIASATDGSSGLSADVQQLASQVYTSLQVRQK